MDDGDEWDNPLRPRSLDKHPTGDVLFAITAAILVAAMMLLVVFAAFER